MIKSELEKLFKDTAKEEISTESFDENWKHFKSLLDGSSLKMKEQALESLCKITAHSLLKGDTALGTHIDQLEFLFTDDPIKPLKIKSLLIDEIILTVTQSCLGLELPAMKFLLELVSSQAEIHGSSLIRILDFFFHIHSFSKNITYSNTAKAALTRIVNLVLQKCQRKGLNMSLGSANLQERRGSLDISNEDDLNSIINGQEEYDPYSMDSKVVDEIFKNDVYLLIRFLCVMGLSIDGKIKDLTQIQDATGDQISQNGMKSRTLALELLVSVLSNYGYMLSSSNHQAMILISRRYLCIVVTKNAALSHPGLFELSISNFLLILRFFLPVLLLEIEVLLNSVFLHILEMENSSNHQKDVVLQGLQKIADSPQVLVDLFVNFDCNVATVSIFDRIIRVCVKITQGKILAHSNPPSGLISMAASAAGFDSRAENVKIGQRLKYRALGVLVSIAQSLLEWTKNSSINTQNNGTTLLEGLEFYTESIAEAPVTLVRNPLGLIKMKSKHSDIPHPSNTLNDTQDAEEESFVVEELANRKNALLKAIGVFNTKPKKGFVLLSELGLFDEKDYSSVALFLRSSQELSKTALGDFLGDGDELNIQIMHAFLDTFDFKNVAFVKAIRLLLQSFRLPGEAQKIDRIMEKFADRFVETNPTVFIKADTAYTLAFSVMMLNTDLHSPSIKHRMEVEDFIRMNRGINDENDLPEEFLTTIFNEVKREEIILEEEHSGKVAQVTMNLRLNDLSDPEKKELYKKEVAIMEKKSHRLISSVDPLKKAVPFKSVRQVEIARLMFSMICWPMMATLGFLFESSPDTSLNIEDSLTLQESFGPDKADIKKSISDSDDDLNFVNLCLQGFMGTIYLASIFKLDTERDALISSLANLTSLSNIAGMKNKNVCAIRIILSLSKTLGEHLDNSWIQILKVISQLEKVQAIKNTANDNQKNNVPEAVEKLNTVVDQLAVELNKQSSIIEIDRIFTSTIDFSPATIIHFFKCICKISLEEVGLTSQIKNGEVSVTLDHANLKPRMYLLQKLVETASYNLHRIRYEWNQIWKILQPHFNAVACHPSSNVAKFAVDSLRQLTVKFLEKEELEHFSAQIDFLKSFEWIMKNSTNREVQDLILSSITQMLSVRAKNIRSGWSSIFVTIGQAAKQNQEPALIRLAFSLVQIIFDSYFELIQGGNVLVEYIACLSEFAQLNQEWDIVSSSIELLGNCGVMLMKKADTERIGGGSITPASRRSCSPSVSPEGRRNFRSLSIITVDKSGLITEDHFHLEWLPLFIAFSKIAIHSENVTVGCQAVDAVFELFNSCGHLFAPIYWKYLQRNVIFPIFEDLKDMKTHDSSKVVLVSALRLWVETYTKFLKDILLGSTGEENLRVFLNLMTEMMGLKDEKLAAVGQICFSQWVQNNFQYIETQSTTKIVIEYIKNAFRITNPVELISCRFEQSPGEQSSSGIFNPQTTLQDSRGSSTLNVFEKGQEIALRTISTPMALKDLDFDHTKIKCMNHLELIQSMGKIFICDPLEESIILLVGPNLKADLLECFQESYVVARYFNCHYGLRYAIWKSGLAQHIPNLVKQESASLLYYMKILFFVFRYEGDIPLMINQKEVLVSELLVDEVNDACRRFIDNLGDQVKNQRDISTLANVIGYIFEELANVLLNNDMDAPNSTIRLESSNPLKKHLPLFFKLGIKIMNVDRQDVRAVLQDFLEKVGDQYIKV